MQDTRERIIELAELLIKTRGFNAFSYKDIADPLEIRNAAVHYHFPSKADLGVAVLQGELDRINAVRNTALTEEEQLEKLVATFDEKRKHGYICLMGSMSPDYDTFPPSMQQKLREVSDTIIERLSACLESGRAKKVFHFNGTANDRAMLVVSSLLSSLLMARVKGDEIYYRMRDQLLADLKGEISNK